MDRRYGPHRRAGVSGPHSDKWRDALQEAFTTKTARWTVNYDEFDGIPIGREVNDAMFSQDPRVFKIDNAVTVTVTVPSGDFKPGQPLTVTWVTNGPGVSSYTVGFSLNGGPFNDLTDLPKTASSFTFALPAVTSPSQGQVQVTAKNRSRVQLGQGISRQFTIKSAGGGGGGIVVPPEIKKTLQILTAAKGKFAIGPGRAARIQGLANWIGELSVPVPADVQETLRILKAAVTRGEIVIGPGRAARIRRLSDWVLGLENPPA